MGGIARVSTKVNSTGKDVSLDRYQYSGGSPFTVKPT